MGPLSRGERAEVAPPDPRSLRPEASLALTPASFREREGETRAPSTTCDLKYVEIAPVHHLAVEAETNLLDHLLRSAPGEMQLVVKDDHPDASLGRDLPHLDRRRVEGAVIELGLRLAPPNPSAP